MKDEGLACTTTLMTLMNEIRKGVTEKTLIYEGTPPAAPPRPKKAKALTTRTRAPGFIKFVWFDEFGSDACPVYDEGGRQVGGAMSNVNVRATPGRHKYRIECRGVPPIEEWIDVDENETVTFENPESTVPSCSSRSLWSARSLNASTGALREKTVRISAAPSRSWRRGFSFT
jgi:hypothetical protein